MLFRDRTFREQPPPREFPDRRQVARPGEQIDHTQGNEQSGARLAQTNQEQRGDLGVDCGALVSRTQQNRGDRGIRI